jgi:hypothetical protein
VSASGYVVGAAILVALGTGAVLIGDQLRAALVRDLAGPTAILGTAVLAIAVVVLAAEALGAVGLLRRGPLAAVAVALVIAGLVVRRRDPRRRVPMRVRALGWTGAVAAVACALVVGEWSGRVALALRHGTYDIDSLRYHLPLAARFAQTGWITRLHFTELDLLSAFDPLNTELLHAVGMVALGRDVFTPFLNVGWLGLALLAGWCAGRELGRGRGASVAGLLSVAVLAAAPLSAVTQPGAATNDIAVLALVVASVAFLVGRERPLGATAIAGVAAGLALGAKFGAIAPVAALTVLAVWLAPRAARRAHALAWFAGGVPVAIFWYARNLARVGNPIPSVGVPGLPSPHDPVLDAIGNSIADFATHGRFWRHVPHGLDQALGPAWPALLLVVLVAVLVPTLRPRRSEPRLQRGLALVGAAGLVAYAFTPYSAGGTDANPFLFAADVRFAYPAIAVALIALARWTAGSRAANRALVTILCTILVTEQFASLGPYRSWAGQYRLAGVVAAVAAVVVGTTARRWLRPASALLVVMAMVVAVGAFRNTQVRGRYNDGWARGEHHRRIAVVGVPLQYPLFGADLSNRVQYAGHRGGHGAFSPLLTCADLARELARQHADHLVVGPSRVAPPGTPEVAWAERLGGRITLADGGITVIAIPPRVDAARCS